MIAGKGRPLRFVACVAVGWIAARVTMLWPTGAVLPDALQHALPIGTAIAATPTYPHPAHPFPPDRTRSHPLPPARATISPPASPTPHTDRARADLALLGLIAYGPEQVWTPPPGVVPPRRAGPPVLLPQSAQPSGWSASGWFVTRRGASATGAMLGGDQAGLRLAYAPGDGRLALFARASGPLSESGRELAMGIDWQPTSLPVRLVAEQRIALDDGARGGTAVAIVGGVDGIDLPFDFKLEAYGQAGAVARNGIDPFADGALRITREVTTAGRARLALGGGAWGAAQRDAARIDVGPGAVATLPVGDGNVRVALDWRERVAGDARPGSGPALSIGADF